VILNDIAKLLEYGTTSEFFFYYTNQFLWQQLLKYLLLFWSFVFFCGFVAAKLQKNGSRYNHHHETFQRLYDQAIKLRDKCGQNQDN